MSKAKAQALRTIAKDASAARLGKKLPDDKRAALLWLLGEDKAANDNDKEEDDSED